MLGQVGDSESHLDLGLDLLTTTAARATANTARSIHFLPLRSPILAKAAVVDPTTSSPAEPTHALLLFGMLPSPPSFGALPGGSERVEGMIQLGPLTRFRMLHFPRCFDRRPLCRMHSKPLASLTVRWRIWRGPRPGKALLCTSTTGVYV